MPMAMDAATPGPEKCFPDSPVPLLFAAETGVCTLETRHSPYSGPVVKYLGGFLAGATRTDTLSFTNCQVSIIVTQVPLLAKWQAFPILSTGGYSDDFTRTPHPQNFKCLGV